MNRDELLEKHPELTTSLGASGWDEDRIDIIGRNGNDGLAYSAPAWSGEGLPPVGARVRLYLSEDEVEVVCHGVGDKFCGRDDDGFIGIWPARSVEPIRSDEDKAVEEMLALDDYDTESYNSGMMSREEFCRAIYRDGYRKLEATQ